MLTAKQIFGVQGYRRTYGPRRKIDGFCETGPRPEPIGSTTSHPPPESTEQSRGMRVEEVAHSVTGEVMWTRVDDTDKP